MLERPADCGGHNGRDDEAGEVDCESGGTDAGESVLLVDVGEDGEVAAEGGEQQEEEGAQSDCLLPRSHYISHG